MCDVLCEQYGEGVIKDLEEAARLYRLAADQGNAVAQNNLGFCYKVRNSESFDTKECVMCCVSRMAKA